MPTIMLELSLFQRSTKLMHYRNMCTIKYLQLALPMSLKHVIKFDLLIVSTLKHKLGLEPLEHTALLRPSSWISRVKARE